MRVYGDPLLLTGLSSSCSRHLGFRITSKVPLYSSRRVIGCLGGSLSLARYSAGGGEAGGCARSLSTSSVIRRSEVDLVVDVLDTPDSPPPNDDDVDFRLVI